MDAKNKIIKILKENKTLKEELNMVRKRLRENEANVDSQAPASAPAPSGDFAKAEPKAVAQDSKNPVDELKENEANVDSQAPAKGAEGSGAKPEPKAVGQDTADSSDVLKEQEGEEEEPKLQEGECEEPKLQEGEEEEPMQEGEEEEPIEPENTFESFKEQVEDDMGKMVELLEAMKDEVDGMKDRLKELEGEDEKEEPLPPMEEKLTLNNAFVDITSPEMNKRTLKEDYGRITRNLLA